MTEGVFLTSKNEKPVETFSPKKLVLLEMEQDISLFTKEIADLIRKKISGEELKGAENSAFNNARDSWWSEKYGFPYELTAARNEVLHKKYSPSEEKEMVIKLQKEMLEAILSQDQSKLLDVRKKYEDRFKEDLEGVTVIFELNHFLSITKDLDSKIIYDKKERAQAYRELTEYQFLLTDFLRRNSSDKDFLKIFWEVMEEIAKASDSLKSLHGLRRSILSQVAVYKIFESLGKSPSIAHPDEDAFSAIDLWAEHENDALQIKTVAEDMEPAVVEMDQLSFPSVLVSNNQRSKEIYQTKLADEFSKFKFKLKKYQEYTGKNIKGHLLVIPKHKYDPVTGEPDKDLVEFFREKLS